MEKKKKTSDGFGPVIRRAAFQQLTIYEISDSELEQLERGTPESLYLNFSIFLVSVAISFSITLFTTTIGSDRIFNVFIIFTIIGYIVGIILLFLWWSNRKNIYCVIDNIKKRLPAEGIQNDIPTKIKNGV